MASQPSTAISVSLLLADNASFSHNIHDSAFFPHLLCSSSEIRTAFGASIIQLSTILTLLCDASPTIVPQGTLLSRIFSILQSQPASSPIPPSFLFETVRIPAFGDTYSFRNTLTGFRHISLQSLFPSGPSTMAASLFSMNCEHPLSLSFITTWKPSGFIPETHFFLIISDQFQESSIPTFGPPSTSGRSTGATIPSTPLWDEILPVDGDWIGDGFLDGFQGSQSFSATTQNPPIPGAVIDFQVQLEEGSFGDLENLTANADHSLSDTVMAVAQQSSPTAASIGSADLWDYLRQHGVAEGVLMSAVYFAHQSELTVMVANLRSMSQVLTSLGLPPYHSTSHSLLGTTTLENGVTVQSEEVLARFSWSTSTYKKKAQAYAWAETAALQKWKTNQDRTHPLYGKWQAIMWLFGQDRNTPLKQPHPDSPNFAERQAAMLCQNDLFSPNPRLFSDFLE